LSGLGFVALFGLANALWALDTPDLGAMPVGRATDGEILRFYRGSAQRIVAGALLSLISIAVFVLFAAAIRRVLIDADGDDVLASTAFGGGLLAMATGLGAETLNMVGGLRAQAGVLDASLGRSLFEVSQVLGYNAAGIGLGVFLVATATVALRTRRVVPRPLGVVALVVGVSLLTPLSRVTLALGLIAVAGIAVALLRAGEGERSAAAAPGPP
jgi:hypothetical protein